VSPIVACAGALGGQRASAPGDRAPTPGAPVVAGVTLPAPIQLTKTPDIAERQPAWSPDGRWIAHFAGSAREGDLWIVTPDGATSRRLTSDPYIEACPAWSPDGERIVFSASRGQEPPALWILDVADTSVARLSTEKRRVHEPAWSPDDKEIVYYGVESGDEQVWSVPAAGGTPRRLSHHATQSWSAAWSPSSEELVFSGYRSASTGGALYIMPRGGEGESCERSRPLTRRKDHTWDRFPEWSRDGGWIVFAAQTRDGGMDLWLVSADGGIEERLTNDPAEDTAPSWSPDGSRIVFESNRGGSPDLWLLDVSAWTAAHHSREAPNRK
jgi:TolB protein